MQSSDNRGKTEREQSEGLANQNVTGPAPIDQPPKEERPAHLPGLEDLNITQPDGANSPPNGNRNP